MTMAEKIEASLRLCPGLTARELASRLQQDKHEVNSHLYTLETVGRTRISPGFRWYVVEAGSRTVGKGASEGCASKQTRSTERVRAAEKAATMSNIHASAEPPKALREIVWTEEQKRVINAPPDARLLVEAGPGTGKTAVACARVAKLLSEDDVSPGSILMVSFTRTAVAEMKNRIRLWADAGRVSAVNICTLDQAAFTFGHGCGEKFENLMGSFEGNIEKALLLLQGKHPLLCEYASGLSHVIIDEAQDLTGNRSQLVRLLIEALPAATGITVFADEAQAIYGFTNDLDDDKDTAEQFLKAFNPQQTGFKCLTLEEIHRTQEPRILQLFGDTRKALREGSVKDVITTAQAAAESDGEEVKTLPLKDGDLVLYRKRASALMHAQYCPTLFRLRLPNHPPAVFPWIGRALSAHTNPLLSRNAFNELWAGRVPAPLRDGFTEESAWALLHRFARDRDNVSLSRLRTLLSRPRPRVEFCQLDYGCVGPVFTTIHASKGREAERVFLMLPRNLAYLDGDSALDKNEEARVFYVGSTRVRSEFHHGVAPTMVGAGRLDKEGRRVAQILALNKLPKFQIGLSGDFDDMAPVSKIREFCPSEAGASAHQSGLVTLWANAVTSNTSPEVNAKCEGVSPAAGKPDYHYRFTSGANLVAWSARSLHLDFWTACNLMEDRAHCTPLRPPDNIDHLRLIGLRTCAIEDNPAVVGNLREPFASSGFWLAPMIVGFASVFLVFQKNRSGQRQ